MSTKAEARIEVKASASEKTRFQRAAERRGISLSDWIRRRLAAAAEAELAFDEPPLPSREDVAAAITARGKLKGAGLRERVRLARATPWIASR